MTIKIRWINLTKHQIKHHQVFIWHETCFSSEIKHSHLNEMFCWLTQLMKQCIVQRKHAGCKESEFYSLPLEQAVASPKNHFELAGLITILWFEFPQKNSTCPLGKLRTKINSPITKSTSNTFSANIFLSVVHEKLSIHVSVQIYSL